MEPHKKTATILVSLTVSGDFDFELHELGDAEGHGEDEDRHQVHQHRLPALVAIRHESRKWPRGR